MNNMIKEAFKGDMRVHIKKGIDKAVDAVKPTLGAVGKTAIIDLGGDFYPIEADDGITVLRNLKFKDRFEQMGLLMVKKRVQMVSEEGGDATATTSTLIQAVTHEAFKEWGGKQENTANIVSRLEQGLKHVIERLQAHSKAVSEQDIERVATVASLDPEIGKIIAEAYSKVGKEGIITVENSAQIGYSSEVVKGARFNQGFISPYFITNPEKLECVLENPAILIVNRRIAANSQLKILEKLIQNGINNILIIADNVEGEALASLVLNHQKGLVRVCAVKPQYEADKKNEWMQDMAILTGAKVISEETGIIMENVDESYIGSAEKVIVNRKNTTIVNGRGDGIEERANVIRNLIAEEKNDQNKKHLEERLGSLIGGIGVIRVGAFTDTELQNMKYKINNAINVVKGGLEEGVIIGGGSALAKIACERLDPIFERALEAPLRTMATNAGKFDKPKGIDKLLFKKPTTDNIVYLIQNISEDYGVNFLTGKLENLFETGVIDSAKNTRLALEAAVSVAKSLIKAETIITEENGQMEN